MEWLWSWRGKCFGYRDGDNLWMHHGKHVGKFYDDEIYDSQGYYIGKIRGGNRLITKTSKKQTKKKGYVPRMDKIGRVQRIDKIGKVMHVGYEDIPNPEQL